DGIVRGSPDGPVAEAGVGERGGTRGRGLGIAGGRWRTVLLGELDVRVVRLDRRLARGLDFGQGESAPFPEELLLGLLEIARARLHLVVEIQQEVVIRKQLVDS